MFKKFFLWLARICGNVTAGIYIIICAVSIFIMLVFLAGMMVLPRIEKPYFETTNKGKTLVLNLTAAQYGSITFKWLSADVGTYRFEDTFTINELENILLLVKNYPDKVKEFTEIRYSLEIKNYKKALKILEDLHKNKKEDL